RERTQRTGERAESGGRNVLVNPPGQLLDTEVAVQALGEIRAYQGEQLRAPLSDASAEQYSSRSGCQDQSVGELPQGVGDWLPHGTVPGQLARREACPRSDCRPGGEAFDAVTVKRTVARPLVTGEAGDAHVAELGMTAAEYRAARHDEAD